MVRKNGPSGDAGAVLRDGEPVPYEVGRRCGIVGLRHCTMVQYCGTGNPSPTRLDAGALEFVGTGPYDIV